MTQIQLHNLSDEIVTKIETSTALGIKGTAGNVSHLPIPNPLGSGATYLVDGTLYVYDEVTEEYYSNGEIQGVQGLQGIQGVQGIQGDEGKEGERGAQGLSAYETALNNGFVGTELQWVHSLRGDDGENGADGEKGEMGNGFDIEKVYGSLNEAKADETNSLIPEGAFILINSEDEDNGSLYVKKDEVYMFQAKLVGVRGEQGEVGKRGRGVVVKGNKPTEGELPLTGLEGDAYWVGDRLYIWSNDPKEIVEPGFVRGNSLKGNAGNQGIQGIQGVQGKDADVTSVNIKNALGYTPANQEILDSHVSVNASKTVKGHMQVGSGLAVSNGIVSVERTANVAFDNNTTAAQFPVGVTEIPVQAHSSSPYYTDLRNALNSAMGYALGDRISYRFYVKVIKRSNLSVRQEVSVTSNLTNSIGHEMFKLQRETNFSDGSFYPWRVSITTMSGNRDPNDVLWAMRGCLYYDYTSGKLYRKNTGTSDGSSSGWVVIAG